MILFGAQTQDLLGGPHSGGSTSKSKPNSVQLKSRLISELNYFALCSLNSLAMTLFHSTSFSFLAFLSSPCTLCLASE